MPLAHHILATAGHVDHGKSALVRALTGTDPDRLPEEKARGITIDLGFAHLDLPSNPHAPHLTLRLGLIDVPGHEDFVKNMVAGVGSIDLALLVVAADDGWMPQTEEHLQILQYLNVSRAVVALTKIDLARDEPAAQRALRENLRNTNFATAPIVPTSILTGRGIDDLKSALASVLASTPAQPDLTKPRLPIDRVFTLRGIGTVVTGTLTGGTLRRGQPVVLQPGARPARIRSIQSYGRDVDLALPGSRVALNLPDLHPATATADAASTTTVRRGDVITLPDLGPATTTLDVLVEISPRATAVELKSNTPLRVHHASAHAAATLHFLEAAPALKPGQSALAQLRLQRPLFAFTADRLVLRDAAEQRTLAGATVLDPHPARRGLRADSRKTFLQSRAQNPTDPLAFVHSEVTRANALPVDHLGAQSRFSPAQLAAAATQLVESKTLTRVGAFLALPAWYQSLQSKALEAIDAHHRAHPESPGLPLADVRAALAPHLRRADVFDPLLSLLLTKECTRDGALIRRATHAPALPAHLRAAGDRIRATLAARGLDAPALKDLAPDPTARQALRFLVQTGQAVELPPDLVLHAPVYHKAVETLRAAMSPDRPATLAQMKDTLGITRRVMVPLAEKLDRDHLTLRRGDLRFLRKNPT